MINMLHPFVTQIGFILAKIIFLLVAIAYYTIAERKIMAAIQRRRGPNVVGFWGLLQPLADGLKLIAKEMITPSHSNSKIFVIAPIAILTLGLLTWSIVPFCCLDYSEQLFSELAPKTLFLETVETKKPECVPAKGWDWEKIGLAVGGGTAVAVIVKVTTLGWVILPAAAGAPGAVVITAATPIAAAAIGAPAMIVPGFLTAGAIGASFATAIGYFAVGATPAGCAVAGCVVFSAALSSFLNDRSEQLVDLNCSRLAFGSNPHMANSLNKEWIVEHPEIVKEAVKNVLEKRPINRDRMPRGDVVEDVYNEFINFDTSVLSQDFRIAAEIARLQAQPRIEQALSEIKAAYETAGLDLDEVWVTHLIRVVDAANVIMNRQFPNFPPELQAFDVVNEEDYFGNRDEKYWENVMNNNMETGAILSEKEMYAISLVRPGRGNYLDYAQVKLNDITNRVYLPRVQQQWLAQHNPLTHDEIKQRHETLIEYSLITELNDISNVSYGLLFILALSSLTVYGLIIAGWASNSKYAFLGALRSAAQMISYEVAISLVILPIILMSGSLNLTKIVFSQILTLWFFAPLSPVSIIFFISMIAETNRTPFDLPEAEAELVAGYNVEYSSIIFAMFFLAEYSNMILMSLLKVILFFGGWQKQIADEQLPATGVPLKGLVFCFLFVLIRATFPRYRYDQLMDIGWKMFLPISTGFLVFVVGAAVAFLIVPILHEIKAIAYTEQFKSFYDNQQSFNFFKLPKKTTKKCSI